MDKLLGYLNPEYPGLGNIVKEEGKKAENELAAFFRSYLDSTRDKYFSIPYEKPENVYKLPGESDEEACERIIKGTLVSVGVPSDFGSVDKVDWHSNPTYNGYKEWTWQFSRHNDVKLLAHQYLLSGKKEYAEAAASLMSSWIATCPPPAPDVSGGETDCWRTIECGIRMGANWPYIIYVFYKDFSDELLCGILLSLYQHGWRLRHNYMSANWRLMEMNGLMHISVLFPFFRDSEEWKAFAIKMMQEESEKQIYPDGFQYELTTGYHEVAINNYQRFLSVMQAFGLEMPSSLIDVIKRGAEVNIKLMLPSGRLPDINDGTDHFVKELLMPKTRLISDDSIDWVISDGKKGRKPSYDSIALEYSGFFVFRTGWGKDDVYALFDSAPFGRGHQHEDKLSFMIADGERILVADSGCYAYDDSDMRKYTISSYGHNVMLIDGMGQNRRRDYVWHDEDIKEKSDLEWEISEDLEWARGGYSGPYGDDCEEPASWKRSIYFVKKSALSSRPYFIIHDAVEGSTEHEYTMLYHVDAARKSISSDSAVFDGIAFSFDGEGELSSVRGAMHPVQGMIATGKEQGMYKSVDALEYRKTDSSCSFLTVISLDGSTFSVKLDGDFIVLSRDGKEERVGIRK